MLSRKAEGVFVRKGTWVALDRFSTAAIVLVCAQQLYQRNRNVRKQSETDSKTRFGTAKLPAAAHRAASRAALHDSAWKESRGRADWVIVTAVDEHLYHPAGVGRYLRVMACRGVTAVPALAFQMVADAFPSPQEYLAKTRNFGVPLDSYNKLSVFNPDAILETRYEVGRHRAVPEGHVRYPKRDQLLLFHYKFLGLDYLVRRYALLSSGLGAVDREMRFGFQYLLRRSELETEFAQLCRTAVDATSATARHLTRERWWRSHGAERA